MAKRYADRVFVTVNGYEIVDAVRADLVRTKNLTRKSTMTRNRRDLGFTEGNLGVQVTLEVAVDKKKAAIDTALADDDAEINVVFEIGGDRYQAKDCVESEMRATGQVGDASKTITLEALDCVNENGTSVNFDIALG